MPRKTARGLSPRRQCRRVRRRVSSVGTGGVRGNGEAFMTVPVTERVAWRALQTHHAAISKQHLRELFAADPGRADRFSLDACSIHLDYSKNRIGEETLQLLVRLANESGLRSRIDAMFRGDKI